VDRDRTIASALDESSINKLGDAAVGTNDEPNSGARHEAIREVAGAVAQRRDVRAERAVAQPDHLLVLGESVVQAYPAHATSCTST
jgi:hypothetical protein